MPKNSSRLRVRYSETDQMGVVYHGNYLHYFEVGRTELIRRLGLPYSELEARGWRLVVVEASLRLRAPARYDDELLVETRVGTVSRVRVEFDYRVRRVGEDPILAEGRTVLASVGENGRPRRLPEEFHDALVAARDGDPDTDTEVAGE